MPWRKVRLTPAQAAENEHGRIQDEFWALFRNAGAPDGMAMFSAWDWDDEPSLHLYFSPETEQCATAFLQAIGAQPCTRPSIVDGLDAGQFDAFQRFRLGQM